LLQGICKVDKETYQVAEPISQGSIFIRGDALLPRSMQLKSQPFSKSWTRVAPEDRRELDRQINDAGWSLFYLAGEIKASAFGHDEKAVRRAVERILAGQELEKFNCMEITTSKTVRFLAMPFVTLTAHARQIQEGATLLQPRWNANHAKQYSTDVLRKDEPRKETYERGTHVVNQW
jgi:hypothetical protein